VLLNGDRAERNPIGSDSFQQVFPHFKPICSVTVSPSSARHCELTAWCPFACLDNDGVAPAHSRISVAWTSELCFVTFLIDQAPFLKSILFQVPSNVIWISA
jgi:hypothetical protein